MTESIIRMKMSCSCLAPFWYKRLSRYWIPLLVRTPSTSCLLKCKPISTVPAERPDAIFLTYHLFLNKAHKSCALDLNRVAVSVIQRNDKVEKVALSQIVRWLLLKMRSGESGHPELNTKMTISSYKIESKHINNSQHTSTAVFSA